MVTRSPGAGSKQQTGSPARSKAQPTFGPGGPTMTMKDDPTVPLPAAATELGPRHPIRAAKGLTTLLTCRKLLPAPEPVKRFAHPTLLKTCLPPLSFAPASPRRALATYFASGWGRIWKCTTSGLVPFPVSMCQGVLSPLGTHRPRPFHPAWGSSMRPSNPFM